MRTIYKWLSVCLVCCVFCSLFGIAVAGTDIQRWGWQGDIAYYSGDNGLIGLLNREGECLTEPIYEQVEPFYEGIAAVMQNGLWGFIREDGSVVSEPQWEFDTSYNTFEYGIRFKNGFAKVCKNGLFGYINTNGEVISEPQWRNASAFSDGLARVYQGKRCGYIDGEGNIAVELSVYTDGYDFANGYAVVNTGYNGTNLWTVIDKTGRRLMDKKWKSVRQVYPGIFCVNEGNYEHLLGAEGKFLPTNTVTLSLICNYCDGVVMVGSGNHYFYLNTEGVLLKNWDEGVVWDNAYDFSEGLGLLHGDEGYAYMDADGNVVLRTEYERVGSFHDGLAYALINKRYGYINTKGEIAIEPQWYTADAFYNGYAVVSGGNGYGLINTKGEIVIPCEWKSVGNMNDGLASVRLGDLCGYANASGEVVIELKWTDAGPFENGKAKVWNNEDKWMYIDTEGTPLYPLFY